MPNIKKISALRNYSDVLDEVAIGNPVFLTKNGTGRFALIDIDEYQSLKQSLWQRLFAELDGAVANAEKFGWISEKKADTYIDGLIEG
jgi:prevent-host-death family protein